MRIAIIGAGISGLVAAYRMRDDHDLIVFEANSHAGGHTNTVRVSIDNEQHDIDTGFIVHNDRNYPNFVKLLEELRVDIRPTVMSFSVHDEETGLEYNGHSPNSLFAQRRNLMRPRFYRMLADILRFNHEARRVAQNTADERTVDEFLAEGRYSPAFARHYLLPMGSAIWSCPVGTFGRFPIRFIAEFYENHGLLNLRNRPKWRVIANGSHTYVKAITNALGDRIRLETPVVSVRRSADEVQILVRDGSVETFDHVVFACHADQALRILGEEASDVEREVLSAFPYERNVAVLHTDTRLLPVNRRAWASWNYRVRVDPTAPALVTYNMNLLQSLNSRRTFCVTLNGLDMIAPEKVMGSFSYEHPIFTVRRDRYQARYRELLRANRTSYCGAYWGDGFHEAGVRSGLMVANAMREGSRRAEHAAEATTISPEIKRAPPEFQPMTPLDALS